MKKKLIFKFCRDFFVKYWRKELVVFIMIIIESVLALIAPFLNKILIDDVFINKEFNKFYTILFGMISVYVIQIIFSFLKNSLFFQIGERVLQDLRLRLIKHILCLPKTFFAKMTIGELISRIESDVVILQQIASSVFVELIANIISMVFTISVIFYLNWRLSIITIVIIMIYFLIYNVFGKHTREKSKENINAVSTLMGALSEMLSNITVIKVFNRQEWMFNKISIKYEQLYKKSLNLKIIQSLNINSSNAMVILGIGTLWFVGGKAIINGTMSIGDVIAFSNYQTRLFSPLRLFSNLNNQLQNATVSLERIYSILEEKPEEDKDENRTKLHNIKGEIEFRNVCFSYNNSNNILKNINFKVNQGEIVAFVGASGCGKSSIFKLLTRLYIPQNGDIFIDGINIKDCDIHSLREQISIIPQESNLFKMSIYENLIFGDLSASRDSVEQIMKKVDIEEFIKSMPLGCETYLEEGGSNLSGGQKKRVEIGRGLIKDSKILIIDEATNSLDNDRKERIKNLIYDFKGKKTILLISHRLSEVQAADRIFVMENGMITSFGDHYSLLKKSKVYRNLYEKEINFKGNSYE